MFVSAIPRKPIPERSTMKTVELVCRSILHILLAACAAFLCMKLCTGCAHIDRGKAHGTVAFVLREAYANGGAAAVSNRIEQFVADGKVTPAQARVLHASAAKLYTEVVEKLETDVAATVEK